MKQQRLAGVSLWRALMTAGIVAALSAALLPVVGGHSQTAGFPGSTVLGRPTDGSVAVNVVADVAVELYVEYGPAEGGYPSRTQPAAEPALSPYEVVLDGLEPNGAYHYRLRYRLSEAVPFDTGATFTFHTRRPPGSEFTFVIQADSHLDEQSDMAVYHQALRNMANDRADFLIDLGDTFFSEKTASNEAEVIGRHLLQRPLLGMVAASAPLFLTLGNHEGEWGATLDGTPDNLAIWATRARQRYYPNPVPDGFYTGDTEEQAFVGLREDYYAWTWGDVLFVVLDPYWHTTVKPQRAGTNWAWTLGERQYRWLVETLEGSAARFKLVFIHNLVGGVSFEGRGGVEAAPYYEWGGRDPGGTWGFDRERPGWGRPIHQVLVDTGVSALFHGHDHLFARQDLGGLVYQEVPQPSHPRGGTNHATDPDYQYLSGDILGSSGHLRLRVAPDVITVEYVRAFRGDEPRDGPRNGAVDHRYEIRPRGAPPVPTASATASPPDPTDPPPTATPRPPGPPPASATPPLVGVHHLYLPRLQ